MLNLECVLRIFLGSFLISPVLFFTAIDQFIQVYLEEGLLVLILFLIVCELFVSFAIFLMITGTTYIAFGAVGKGLYYPFKAKEICNLLNEFRETIDNEMYYNATDYEIVESFIKCAIIKAKEQKQ